MAFGRSVASWLMVGAVVLLATIGTTQAQLVGHGGMVKGVAVSGDGTRVASAGFDYSVMLWDLKAAGGCLADAWA